MLSPFYECSPNLERKENNVFTSRKNGPQSRFPLVYSLFLLNNFKISLKCPKELIARGSASTLVDNVPEEFPCPAHLGDYRVPSRPDYCCQPTVNFSHNLFIPINWNSHGCLFQPLFNIFPNLINFVLIVIPLTRFLSCSCGCFRVIIVTRYARCISCSLS